MATQEDFDFERFKKETIAGLYAGKKMNGTNGVLALMMKQFLQSMMTGELEHHLSESKQAGQANRQNGKSKKTVRSLSSGEFELETGKIFDNNIRLFLKFVVKKINGTVCFGMSAIRNHMSVD